MANLDQVPEAGALVIIGYPKFGGGLGSYARYIAVCPSDWPYGVMVGQQDAPLSRRLSPEASLTTVCTPQSMQRVVLVPEVTVRRE